jgi:hypothetical protein
MPRGYAILLFFRPGIYNKVRSVDNLLKGQLSRFCVSKRIKNNHIRLPDFPHMRSERQMRKKN